MRVIRSSASPYAAWPAEGLKLHPSSFYRRALRELSKKPRTFALLAFSSVSYAVGHAALALAAGASATVLLASKARLRELVAAVDAHGAAVDPKAISPVVIAALGIGAALVKTAAGAASAHLQSDLSGEVGRHLRLAVLDGWLARTPRNRPGHDDPGGVAVRPADALAGLVHHVRDVEQG